MKRDVDELERTLGTWMDRVEDRIGRLELQIGFLGDWDRALFSLSELRDIPRPQEPYTNTDAVNIERRLREYVAPR